MHMNYKAEENGHLGLHCPAEKIDSALNILVSQSRMSRKKWAGNPESIHSGQILNGNVLRPDIYSQIRPD